MSDDTGKPRRPSAWIREHGPVGLTLGLLVPVVVGIWASSHFWWFTLDESFVSFRTARNYASGLGLVFNPGEPIEVYGSFAWTVLLGWGMRVGLDPVALSKILGVASFVVILASAYALSRRIMPGRAMPPLAPLLLATTPVLASHAVLGLETAMFAACLFGGVLAFVREEQDDRTVPWSGLWFALGALTRAEAPIVIGIAMLSLGGPHWSPKRPARWSSQRRPTVMLVALMTLAAGLVAHAKGWTLVGGAMVVAGVASGIWHAPARVFSRRNLVRTLLFAGPVLAHASWRHAAYGTWWPPNADASVVDPARRVGGGLQYVQSWMEFEGSMLVLMLFGFGAALAWSLPADHRPEGAPPASGGTEDSQRWISMLAGVTVGGLTVIVLAGGDATPAWRRIAPYQPFAYLLVGLAVRQLWQLGERWLRMSILVALAFSLWERHTDIERREANLRTPAGQRTHVKAEALGAWFEKREARLGRDRVAGSIAYADIGELGYSTDYPMVDHVGRLDLPAPPASGEPPANDFVGRLLDKAPRYMIIHGDPKDCRLPRTKRMRTLKNDQRFEIYRLIGDVRVGKERHCVWERGDLSVD